MNLVNASLPVLCIVIGLLLWGFGSPKAAELGKLMFFAGILALCMKGVPAHL